MVASRVKNTKKSDVFFWPDKIIYKDSVIYAAQKEPNFALYVCGTKEFNRHIYLNKDQVRKWIKDNNLVK